MVSGIAKYAFVNAKLRARISKILPDEVFDRLVKAPSLDSALDVLRDTSFADLQEIYSSTGDLKKGELELLKKEIDLYRNIKQSVHAETIEFINALLCQFEIDNIKNAIRIYFDRKIRNISADPNIHYILYDPILHKIPIDVIINAESFVEISEACSETPYENIIKKYSGIVESQGSLFRLEIALDHFYYDNLMAVAKKMDSDDRDIVRRLTGVEIDLQNINWLIRLKNFYDLPLEAVLSMLVPGGYNLNRAMINEIYKAQNVTGVLQSFVSSKYPGLTATFIHPELGKPLKTIAYSQDPGRNNEAGST